MPAHPEGEDPRPVGNATGPVLLHVSLLRLALLPTRPILPAYAHGMEQSEVLKRVIGILTQAGDWQRRLEEDTSREQDMDAEMGVVTELLNETMPRVEVPADATPEELSALLGREVGGAVEQLVGAFTLAFVTLARVHDADAPDVSSADILQDLALRAEEL